MHSTPKSSRAKQGRKGRRSTAQGNEIDKFFVTYPDFDYNPSAQIMEEFYRMCDFFDWDREDPEKEEARDAFRRALVHDFNSAYGKDVDDISAWQYLCKVVHISPVPDDIKTCRRV